MITLALLSSWHPSRYDVSPLDLYKPITRGPTKTLQTLKGVRLLGAKKLRFIKIATFGCTYPLWIFNGFEPPQNKSLKNLPNSTMLHISTAPIEIEEIDSLAHQAEPAL